jgi:chitodextrinase
MATRLSSLTIAAAALALSAACTTSQQTVPPLAGPSEFALSLRMTASPDSLSQDGASQSTVAVNAYDENGRPVSNLEIRVDMIVNNQLQDYGTLTQRTIRTAANGQATTVYTAPPPPPPAAGGSSTIVVLRASPTLTNNLTANFQIATIRLVPTGVIQPPASTPTARFTYPVPVNILTPVTFDASASCPGGVDSSSACLPPTNSAASITSYAWSFGDGGAASGRVATHTFTSVGTFTVKLTVTNDRGVSASTQQLVTTTVSTGPTGDWLFSPAVLHPGDKVLFNADGIQAAPGHSIVQYSWDFGDPNADPTNPNTASVFNPTHTYTVVGTYTVVLSVLDDAGQKKTIAKTVTIVP